MMRRQKRVATINDITGFGRCAAAVMQPIISAMKIQCCVIPTAVLSVHTGFPDYFLHDFTPYFSAYMDSWEKTGLEFDGICSGFLGSEEQISMVEDFFCRFKKEETLVLVDPVMGDEGRLYSSYTEAMSREMKRLLPYADVITPNLTEACRLLDVSYDEADISPEGLDKLAAALGAMGPDRVVITGLPKRTELLNYVYEKNKTPKIITTEKIGGERSGTGDVFSSVVTGALVRGYDFEQAVSRAVSFLDKAIAYTVQMGLPWNYGICFEEFLQEL